MSIVSIKEWKEVFQKHPEAHILQSAQWGLLKKSVGWEPNYLIRNDAGVLLLLRRLPLGYSIAYIPKSEVSIKWEYFLPEIDEICHQNKSIFLKIEPDYWEDYNNKELDRLKVWFQESSDTIQPRSTLMLNINLPEGEILNQMKQKTRYNIRLAEKKGISISTSDDLDTFCYLMKETAARDEFGAHTDSYYKYAFELFNKEGLCQMFLAFFKDTPLAGLMVFRHGKRAWYFFGASIDKERHRMPTYLLQWEAIRWAKNQGCIVYDLWGVPDEPEDYLEANFTNRSDGLWGVYRFKRGFGGSLKRSIGAWDRIYKPSLYHAYRHLLRLRKNLIS